jgi:hypothetical protein
MLNRSKGRYQTKWAILVLQVGRKLVISLMKIVLLITSKVEYARQVYGIRPKYKKGMKGFHDSN